MHSFLRIIKSDYLQRTRSYAFLITMCASLAIAYTFVPEPNADYSTIRFGEYIGYYNSAWIGYVTAIMSSVFLSLVGFYLVNGGIARDIQTKVGQIIAATPISNFKYLLAKVFSNFLVLLTIVILIFIMSLILFFIYNDGFPFEPFQFIKPYVFITLPALFIVSVIAVILEVLLGKYSVLQNIGFFFLFCALIATTSLTESSFSLDVFGDKIIMRQMEKEVRDISGADKEPELNIGYSLGGASETEKFEYKGFDFPTSYILSRFAMFGFGLLLIVIVVPLFHRFNVKERMSKKLASAPSNRQQSAKEISVTKLPKTQINYSIVPLLKTEVFLLFRKGKKWLWILNIIGVLLLAMLPIKMAHQIVLPILWFLQVHRLSDLTVKEMTQSTYYFTFSSNKPIGRLLVSQWLSAILLMVLLAVPLIVRFGLSLNITAMVSILLGAVLIVLLASLLGILSKGKKLFEVLFFMTTYALLNGIGILDYLGAFVHQPYYTFQQMVLILFIGSICILKRKQQVYNI